MSEQEYQVYQVYEILVSASSGISTLSHQWSSCTTYPEMPCLSLLCLPENGSLREKPAAFNAACR